MRRARDAIGGETMQPRGARRTARGFARLLLLPALAAGGLLVGSAAWAEDAADAPDDGTRRTSRTMRKRRTSRRYRALTTQASEIELGFLFNHVDGEPSAFAQYRGLDDDQFYVLGNLDIFRRAPWDSESTQYYRFRGLNLGLRFPLRRRRVRAPGACSGCPSSSTSSRSTRRRRPKRSSSTPGART